MGRRDAALAAVLAMALGGCGSPPAPSPGVVAPVTASPTAPAPPPVVAATPTLEPTPSPASRPGREGEVARIDAAIAAWHATAHPALVYRFDYSGPGGVGWNWSQRVVRVEGRYAIPAMGNPDHEDAWIATLSIEGYLANVRDMIAFGDEESVTWNASGFPVAIQYDHSYNVIDDEGTNAIVALSVPRVTSAMAARARSQIATARRRWEARRPGRYGYTVVATRAIDGKKLTLAVAVPGTGPVRHPDDWTTVNPSISGLLDAAAAAVDSGAWVDVQIDAAFGYPTLIAIDPDLEKDGDAYFLRVDDFNDPAREELQARLAAAADEWDAKAPKRYRLRWTQVTGRRTSVTDITVVNGEATYRRIVPAGAGYPTIGSLFNDMGTALYGGGRVSVSFDKKLGYPVRALIDPRPEIRGDETTVAISRFRAP